ncbi:propionyl-CoA synthetase [Mycobacterium sp. PS03-16]|uniref:propionyl-CoA synthetase n=1 Tax=Mycobacterium sp. PS03-16 TaxID=2559611 RepID=UPI001073122F|nr:propionyl-CoA synthetase [Mycobacterium sp. PS03-16]TFV56632.1 propionyl-CoA synthetase [Mycobacterium sp. PS03-16]
MSAPDFVTTAADAHREATTDPERFWLRAAEAIDWHTAPTVALDHSDPHAWRWFPDGMLNTSHNALDRHIEAGHGDRVALIFDSAMTGTRSEFTYLELRDRVAVLAGALVRLGVTTGDRVVIYLPMIPEALIAMLACARIGAIHSVVFGGFAAAELAARIDDAQPKVLLTASGGLEPGRVVEYLPTVRKALQLSASPPETVVVKDRPEIPGDASDHTGWLDWDTVVADAIPAVAVPVPATHPLYILYTSGTTGKPKGVVRDNGGHAVAMAWSMAHIYGVGPGDVMWTASDVGWVVGHSYIVYAPLIVGATTVLYEGKPVGTPDAGAFWRVVQDARANVLFSAPTALRAIRKEDPNGAELAKYDTSSLHTMFAAGERLDPETYHWAAGVLDRPVIDHWWQTETGWAICANPRGLDPLPVKPGSASVPVPGYDVRVLDANGDEVGANEEGNIAIKLPLPPGSLQGLWNSPERFISSYLQAFPGYYTTGDTGYFDDDGYLFILGRSDDVINVAGHRLTTGSMEAVVATHPAVAECAVIGVPDEVKGQRPVAYVVLKSGADADAAALQAEVVALVRDHIGPVAALKDVYVVPALPKTRSGKILRRTMRQIASGEEYKVPPTIEDAAVLDALPTLGH